MTRTRLRTRLTGLLAVVIVLVLSATLIVSLLIARENAQKRSLETLDIGARVVQRVLDDRMEQVTAAVAILVRDYGFVEAVASDDVATIESVLQNHSARIGADMAAVIALDDQVRASTLPALASGRPFPAPELLQRARRNGFATEIVLLAGVPYQLVVLPVEAPIQIAWASVGFRLDDTLAGELQALTALDVHIIGSNGTTAPLILASSLPAEDRGAVNAILPDLLAHPTETATLDDADYILRTDRLGDNGVALALQTSLDAAMAAFRGLYLNIGIIALLSMLAALVGAFLVARSVTQPLQRLASAALQIRDGRYDLAVAVRDSDGQETSDLADSLNRMREGIAAREERLLHQARHDPLTGLPNRNWAEEQLRAALPALLTGGDTSMLAMVLINLNRFSEINDRFGHERGDEVLREMAARLQRLAGDPAHHGQALVARTGGNEFLFAFPCPDAARAGTQARDVLEQLAEPLTVGAAAVSLAARAGLALAPQHGTQATMLLRRADLVLRDAGNQSPLVIYADGREENHQRDLALAKDLVDAIAANALSLNYQPKVDIRTRRVTGVEALARWRHPQHGFIRPDLFIAMAERSGQIGRLTRWVLQCAMRQAQEWHARGLEIRMSVNLSALDLADRALPDYVETLMAETGLPSRLLCLEVTESTAMQDTDMAIAALERLRALGITTSIDDFGTGFSSLAQLRRLPLDELKIDKGFVLKLQPESSDAAIVRSTIDLAHNMKLKATAEGVETASALALLDDWGCDIAQGYYFSKPLDSTAFDDWLRQFHARDTTA